jgi:sugar lactone lactonase YvrE
MPNFLHPRGVATDACGNLYVADLLGNRVWKVDTNGIITTFAGSYDTCGWNSGGFSGDGNPANQAVLHGPEGLAVDNSGNVYIADTDNNRIRKVGLNGIITTVAGTGAAAYTDSAIDQAYRAVQDLLNA